MRRLSVLAAVLTVLLTLTAARTANGEPMNESKSSGGLLWSTAKEETDLMRPSNDDDSSPADHEGLDGGFSSLDGMLQWAIGHSDPAKLKETAQDMQRLSSDDLKKRQVEIRELMDSMKMPSDAQFMQIAMDDLNNSSLSLEDRHRALQELLILVEPIDNANDLSKLGGLSLLIRELNHSDSDVRRVAAWVLGKASQNHAIIQKQILELGALPTLMKMTRSASVEEAIKALYAVSALIRNNLGGQELFFSEAGDVMLQDIIGNSSIDIRLLKKAIFLVADLAECKLEIVERAELPFFTNLSLLKSIVDLTSTADLDLQEKVLFAIKNLLRLSTTEALIFKDFCDLDGALERMRLQLQDLMADEFRSDFALDVENLRREVELIFHKKLGEVKQVPK